MACVDENQILDLLEGRMDEGMRSQVLAHVDDCEACRLLFAEMARSLGGSGATTLPLGGGSDAAPRSPAPHPVAAAAFTQGTVLAERYRLEHLLGEGSAGAVWSATHLLLGRPVAIKLLKETEPDVVTRFLREARLTAMLHHPNVVEVHDVLEIAPGAYAMVMERLDGETLRRRLRREGALALGEAARIVVAVASALAAVHGQGVVHRDLKPENIFLIDDPTQSGRPRVKVLDFGLAKAWAAGNGAPPLTRTGALLGTPHYMAPEQVFAEKDIDARADLWALGVILYEAVSGARPVEGDTFGQLFRHITMGRLRPLEGRVAGVPQAIAGLSKRLLERDRRARLESAQSVMAVLSPYAGDDTAP